MYYCWYAFYVSFLSYLTHVAYNYITKIAWAADKLSDDELELTTGESAISPILEDEGELDDGIVTTANSGSGAQGALERRRKEDGRWGDLGLDLFEGNKMEVGSSGQGGGG